MTNCGIGACASDIVVCATEIAKMTVAVIEGVSKAVKFALSLGGSTATESAKALAKKMIMDEMKKLGKNVMKNIY